MTPEEALSILGQVAVQARVSLPEHQQIQAALKTLDDYVKEHGPQTLAVVEDEATG